MDERGLEMAILYPIIQSTKNISNHASRNGTAAMPWN